MAAQEGEPVEGVKITNTISEIMQVNDGCTKVVTPGNDWICCVQAAGCCILVEGIDRDFKLQTLELLQWYMHIHCNAMITKR